MIKIALRNLKKNRSFTFINIIGLAVSMAAAILIMLWVQSELSFDRYYKNIDKTYVVGNKALWSGKTEVWFWTPFVMAPTIETDFPEVEHVVRVFNANVGLLTVGDKKLSREPGLFADAAFFTLFDYDFLYGNPSEALNSPTNIVINSTLAKKLFQTENAVGKIIKRDNEQLFTVSAVIKDIPSNSMYEKTSFILPVKYYEKENPGKKSWQNNSLQTYIQVKDGANIDRLSKNMAGIISKHSDTEVENVIKPLSEYHLYNKYENGVIVGGRIEMVRVFILIAAFILLIACINFMNLSTAQSEKRAKEVGIRKVVGAAKRSLIRQFLTESILVSAFAGIISLGIVLLSLSSYSQLVNRTLSIPYTEPYFWLFFLLFIFITGVLAGSYPAFFLSSFKPIKALKGKFTIQTSRLDTRKILVVSQFIIATTLIVCTITIRKQINYAQQREVGYNKEKLIYVYEQGEITKNIALIKQELLQQGIASSVSRSFSPISMRWSNSNGFDWEGKSKDNTTIINRTGADDQIVKTVGLELIKGRDFDLTAFPTDSSGAIINESAMKEFGFKDPIGKIIKDGDEPFHIIGVVKDFIVDSPFDPIAPLIIEGAKGNLGTLHIKLSGTLDTRIALNKTEAIFKKYNAQYPFEYDFIDEDYARKFGDSQQTGKLATLFAGLTIFISCLGLFGLSAYMAENRTKEIGIRKVLGASIFSVTKMLSLEFILLVFIACIIAFPLAYWFMNSYLSGYAYRVSVGLDIFAFTAAAAIAICILTVSYQSIKAAIANPVKSLRNE